MSNPTFDSQTLCHRSAVEIPSAPAARIHVESMPGVDGDFVQLHGSGGRRIRLQGEITASGATPSAAHQALKAVIYQRQQLIGRVATYFGTDGQSHGDCVLMSYQPQAARVAANEQDYTASAPITAEIYEAAP